MVLFVQPNQELVKGFNKIKTRVSEQQISNNIFLVYCINTSKTKASPGYVQRVDIINIFFAIESVKYRFKVYDHC